VPQDDLKTEPDAPPPAPLFRGEVFAARAEHGFGEVLLLNPVSHQALTALFASLALALVGFVFLFGFHRKVNISGTIEPDLGLIAVHAPQAGVIAARLVTEGEQVAQGTPLFRLAAERSSVTLGDSSAEVSRLLQQRRASLQLDQDRVKTQAEAHHAASLRRLDENRDEQSRIDTEAALQKRRIELAEEELDRTSALNRKGFLAAAALEDKEAILIDQREKLGELDGARLAARRDDQSIRADMAQQATQEQRDLDALSRSVNEIDGQLAQNEAAREFIVRAPVAGSLELLSANVGDPVSVSQPLGAMVPEHARLEALLFAPSSAIGLIRPGMDVLLRYESFPFQKFGLAHGRVRSIANATLEAQNLAAADAHPALSEPVYRVRVSLDREEVDVGSKTVALKAGMHLDASVVLEERRLYEWILEPLYLLRGQI
jgi:membrane fusion protein